MTPKQRVRSQIEHRETDFIPYTLYYEEEIAAKVDQYYGSDRWRKKINNMIVHVPGPDIVDTVDEEKRTRKDWYGSTWTIDNRPCVLIEPALKESSLEGYKFPDVEVYWNSTWKKKAHQFIGEHQDYFSIAGGVMVYELIWYMRGFENAYVDLAGNPGFYEELADALIEHQMPVLEKCLSLPVDGIMFADDWGMQTGVLIGAERWRKIFKPRMEKLYRRVHEAGKYTLTHCCGSIAEIIPDLIEIGLDVYESVQPEAKNNSPYELKKKYGDKITFWGALGSQSTVPFGTPQDIRKEVRRLCSELGKGGGYILSPAKPLQPETPVENAVAVIESFLEQAGVTLT